MKLFFGLILVMIAFTSCKKGGCTDYDALNYDPEAKFIKKWIPELNDLDPKIIHNWYKYYNNKEYSIYLKKYTKPIVD